VVGSVTDLEVDLASRAISGLRVELERRKRILAQASVSDIKELQPGTLSRLVVVFDEFRALTEELPDAVSQLLRLAAQGRSLGLHLVLATQRAAGAISPEMRANVSAKLALRVVGSAESQDLIESNAAAKLPTIAGRGILVVGAESPIEVQCAWPEGSLLQTVTRCHWAEAKEITSTYPEEKLERSAPTDLVADIKAKFAHHPCNSPNLWAPALPAEVSLKGCGTDLDVGTVFGLADIPEQQTHAPAYWVPSSGGLGVVGATKSGRTTALETIGLAAANLGWQVHFLGTLPAASHLLRHPNFGTEVNQQDPERAGRLLRHLVASASTPSFPGLDGHRDDIRQMLLVDLVELWREFPAILNLLEQLLRHSKTESVAVVLASGHQSYSGLGEILGSQLVLLSGDRSTDVLHGAPSQFAGQGRSAGRAVGFGSAIRFSISASGQREGVAPNTLIQVALPDLVAAKGLNSIPALRLAEIPLVSLAELQQLPSGRAPEGLAVGVGGDRAEVLTLPRSSHFLIAGPHRSGRTNALAVLLTQAVRQKAGKVQLFAKDHILLNVAAELGVGVFSPDAKVWQEWPAAAPDILVIDDLDQVLAKVGAIAEQAISSLLAAGTVVWASATTLATVIAQRGVLAELREARTGLVLHPAERGSDEVFYCQLPPPHAPSLPGTGWLVRDGAAQPIRVAKLR
jgi:S-DNA-T family DNA segregation ATPase FtsK/SpoIIIE